MTRKRKSEAPKAPERPAPSEREKAAIAAAADRVAERRCPVAVAVKDAGTNTIEIASPHTDVAGYADRLKDALGTASFDFMDAELQRLFDTLQPKAPGYEARINAALALIEGIRPTNEMEAVLAVQTAATHAVSMTYLARILKAELIPQAELNLNVATKLQRTLLAQVDALAKLRRGGKQVVKVEHVHVHSGGQAVVGVVNHGGVSGGNADYGERAHEVDARSLAYAPGAPLWSQDPERDAVPVAGSSREA